MEITTGVLNPNKIASPWFWDQDYNDPNFLEALNSAVDEAKEYYLQKGYSESDAFDEALAEVENLGMNGYEESDVLYGKWLQDENNQFYPDPEGEYAALYRGGSFGTYMLQVVHSKWAIRCHHCSPCYPNQGDVETQGSEDMISYILPPDLLDEKWYEENRGRIIEL